MYDHVTIRVSDREASRRFYEAGLRALALDVLASTEHYDEWNDFGLAPARVERPATRRLHVAFAAPSRDAVDAFWRELTEAGHPDDGAPGPRPEYSASYYGAFVLDPDGNSAEAVHRDGVRTDGGVIDHLWLRVRDVAASKRFCETIAPWAGLELRDDLAERVQFAGGAASSSWVAGAEPTENVHLAFPAGDRATVDEFHRAALAAGYRDNGAPGERPQYHEGYYAAFVLDPDGTNVESVFHDRPGA
jgi:catechol 2,3-dioxygenase-like lactoylglutathione lyase family enzyme